MNKTRIRSPVRQNAGLELTAKARVLVNAATPRCRLNFVPVPKSTRDRYNRHEWKQRLPPSVHLICRIDKATISATIDNRTIASVCRKASGCAGFLVWSPLVEIGHRSIEDSSRQCGIQ
jgi:hypothetical protein